MLVLSRYVGESIVIGDDARGQLYVRQGDEFVPVPPISVTVTKVQQKLEGEQGPKVRLGTAADPRVPVHRENVYHAIRGKRNAAAKS